MIARTAHLPRTHQALIPPPPSPQREHDAGDEQTGQAKWLSEQLGPLFAELCAK